MLCHLFLSVFISLSLCYSLESIYFWRLFSLDAWCPAMPKREGKDVLLSDTGSPVLTAALKQKFMIYDYECQCQHMFYDQNDPLLSFFTSYWDCGDFTNVFPLSKTLLCRFCIEVHCPHSPHCPFQTETRLAILVKTACKIMGVTHLFSWFMSML